MSALKYSAVALATLLSTSVSAKQFWSDTSFTLLKGSNYEVGDSDKTVLTLEHASGHSWGGIFAFVDRLKHENDNNHETYGELGFTFDVINQKDSFIKNTFLAAQWEFNAQTISIPGVGNIDGSFDNYLAGAGVGLNIPGAQFFTATVYQRNNQIGDNNQQLTLAWAFPFADSFVYDGFLDAVNGSDTTTGGYNLTSQLKYDVGQHIGVEKGKFYAGIEYVHWNNKFGIPGVNEKNANLLIKWHL